MDEPKPPFVIDGELLKKWDDAVSDFKNSGVAAKREPKQGVEHDDLSDPDEWRKTFRTGRRWNSKKVSAVRKNLGRYFRSTFRVKPKRKKTMESASRDLRQPHNAIQRLRHDDSNRTSEVRTKAGKCLKPVQNAVKLLGFNVNAASVAFPALSPASLVVNAIGWLLESFIKVSENFDRLEGFFLSFEQRLHGIELVIQHLDQLHQQDRFKECIVDIFISYLKICQIGSKQLRSRYKTWAGIVSGSDPLGAELDKFGKLRDHLGIIRDDESFSGDQEIKAYIKNDTRTAMLEWLSDIDSPAMHRKIISDDVVLGGQWLLKSELFERWKGKEPAFNRLWYTGHPGAGKSVLAHTIIEHIKKEISSSKGQAMVAYLYLSYDWKPAHTVTELLGSILRQFQAATVTDSHLVQMFNEYKEGGRFDGKHSRPEEKHIKKMLSQISRGKTAFVIVDGLDEYEVKGRGRLLNALKEISPSVKILVTSRILHNEKHFQDGFQTANIEAHEEDKDNYINFRFQRDKDSFGKFSDRHEDIKEEVKRRSGNMFIILRLHMDALLPADTRAQLNRLLANLPEDLDDTYEKTLERIQNQSKPDADRAICTLGWVRFSERLLSVDELAGALAIEEASPGDDLRDHILQEDTIRSVCCGLLANSHGKLRYIHKSARDFFEKRSEKIFPNFDKRICLALVDYLIVVSRHLKSGDTEDALSKRFPLLDYAGEHLHKHHRRVLNLHNDGEILEKIYLLVSGDPRALYSRLLRQFGAYKTSSALWEAETIGRQPLDGDLPPLHMAVFLGNPGAVQKLIENGAKVNAFDLYRQSAVELAIKIGLDRVAEVLLKKGADVSLETKKGHVILLHAIERDYKGIFTQIMEHLQALMPMQAIEDSRSELPLVGVGDSLTSDSSMHPYRSLLDRAYKRETENVELLLRHLTSEANKLSLASRGTATDSSGSGSKDEDDDCSSFSSDQDCGNPSNGIADAAPGHTLSELDEIKLVFLRTSFFVAVELGRRETERREMEKLKKWRRKMVTMFLEKDISPNLTNHQGRSLLHRVTAHNDKDLVEVLLSKNANVNQRDDNGRTPVMANAGFINKEVLELLISNGADMDLRLRQGSHELYEAAVFGAKRAVAFFLEQGVDPSIKNNFGWTPLHGAAANGHHECVELLLKKGADYSPVSYNYQTPLDFVENSERHYGDTLIGHDLYAAQVLETEALSDEAKEENRKTVLGHLVKKGARTAKQLRAKLGDEEFFKLGNHPSWEYDWWESKNDRVPWIM